MKVKNIAFFGIMAAILGVGGAYAANDTIIASKGYVDAKTAGKQNTLNNGTNVVQSGSGNVVTGVTASDGTVTVTKGNVLADITVTGNNAAGNAITGITASGDTITVTKGTFLTSADDKVDLIQGSDKTDKVMMTTGADGIVAPVTLGDNLKYEGDKLSAIDTTYTAGTNINIENGVISATDTNTTYTFAEGSENGTIKVDNTNIPVHGLKSAAYTNSGDYVAGKQGAEQTGKVMMTTGEEGIVEPVTVGANLEYKDGKLSATDNDTTYTAGTGLDLSGTTFSNSGILDVSATTGNDGEAIITVSKNNQNVTSTKGRLSYKGAMNSGLDGINEGVNPNCSPSNPCVLTYNGDDYVWTNMDLGTAN